MQKKQTAWHRFKSIKRGYYAMWILLAMIIISLFINIIANNKALIVKYEDNYYFPIISSVYVGTTFGQDYQHETDYKALKASFINTDNWVIMPPIPYGPYESDLKNDQFVPTPPDFSNQHFLGTDNAGRDVLVRLLYGFRETLLFAILMMVTQFAIGISIGVLMGYCGGVFDIVGQRIIEIWSAIPALYVIMIMAAMLTPNFWSLLIIMSLFSWMGMTELIRTSVYREKSRDYVLASRAIGASHFRIMFVHIIPNTMAVIVTYLPFSLAGGIVALTSLDYLGFGLPPPTPSWGELLQQGVERLDKPWILLSTISTLVLILVLVAFIGEAIRQAFDPKKYMIYE